MPVGGSGLSVLVPTVDDEARGRRASPHLRAGAMNANPEQHTLDATCAGELGCAMSAPGHDLLPVQRVVAAATPSSWVDAFVGTVEGDGWITLHAADDERTFRVWHHDALTLGGGEPVALHVTYHVLALGRRWVNVLVVGAH
jgi:hypothetical protein